MLFATASKVTKIMRDEQPEPLFCTLLQRTFLLNKGGVVLVNSLMDLKWPKGIRPCKTDWRVSRKTIEPRLDQELNNSTIRILMKKSFFITIWKFHLIFNNDFFCIIFVITDLSILTLNCCKVFIQGERIISLK